MISWPRIFARRTKIIPLDDVDLLTKLNATNTSLSNGSNDPYTYWLKIDRTDAPLAAYSGQHGYVSSTKVLNALKTGVASVSGYSKASIHRDGEAVRLDLRSYPWSFDIVPAVGVRDGQGGIDRYLIPNGKGNWKATDPRKDQYAVTTLNSYHGGRFLPAVRLCKYWNARPLVKRLQSYHFEVIAWSVLPAYGQRIARLPEAVAAFLCQAAGMVTQAVPDPKGLGPNLDTYLSWTEKCSVAKKLREAAGKADRALIYEARGATQSAFDSWRAVFGQEFPTYG